jgi:hypothetical protein
MDENTVIESNQLHPIFPAKLEFVILHRDRNTCQCCQKTKAQLKKKNIDLKVCHIVEVWKGGETNFENGQAICTACFNLKYNIKDLNLIPKTQRSRFLSIRNILKTLSFYSKIFRKAS